VTSTALAGYIGTPTELGIPGRSMKRIQQAIFDTQDRYSLVIRTIEFRAIKTATGANISQASVVTNQVDGHHPHERISIVYRNGRFAKAMAEYEDGTVVEHTLGAAIDRISNPVGRDGRS